MYSKSGISDTQLGGLQPWQTFSDGVAGSLPARRCVSLPISPSRLSLTRPPSAAARDFNAARLEPPSSFPSLTRERWPANTWCSAAKSVKGDCTENITPKILASKRVHTYQVEKSPLTFPGDRASSVGATKQDEVYFNINGLFSFQSVRKGTICYAVGACLFTVQVFT